MTLFHGLPSDRVRAIAQGADGMMWFGTEAGLAKFDGRRTQTLVDAELPQGRVLALHPDANGSLWVGTDTGAARVSAGRVEAVKELKEQTVNAIIEPEHGRLIMATEQGMVYECRLKPEGGFEVRQLLAQRLENADRDRPGLLPLTSLTFAHHRLLAGSLSRGLLAIEDHVAKEIQGRRPAFFVRALETDARGQLWIGTRSRKNEPALRSAADSEVIDREGSVTGTVLALQAGNNDDMWVGTEGNGVYYFPASRRPTRFTFDGTAGGLRSNSVFSIFIDREEVVWFGTDRGVSRYDPNAPRPENIGDNAESNFIRTLYHTPAGHLLAGTNRGLFVYDPKESRWNVVRELSRQIIYSLGQDSGGRLLVGSASGFYVGPRITPTTNIESQTFNRLVTGAGSADAMGSIRGIVSFRGAIYMASYGRGVERFEENRVVNVWPSDAITREVISLHADGDARLLVGTAKAGVFSFDGAQVRRDESFAEIERATVRWIESTPDQTLWFATHQGVYMCKRNSGCTPAAPGYEARSLIAGGSKDRNEVWCGTTGSGLLRITLDDQLGPVVSQLDAEQGLPSQNVFAALPLNDAQGRDAVLIGTSRGVARYTPATTAPTLYAARVISKRVHSPGELQSGLYLEYPQNSLLLDVAAVSSRTFPEKFQYAFTLTDDAGAVIRQRVSRESQFTMEGLAPGHYRVTARAFSKDLVSSAPMSFGLNIARAPFPWTSTALAILLALALLALLWAIMERRRIVLTSAALVAANRELADARLNLANEAERERRRIARDLHDQTLADLRHLLLMSDQLPNGTAGDDQQLDPAALRTEIESISQEVRRICEDLSPSVLQNVGFAAALEFALSHAVQDAPADKRFEYQFDCVESLEEKVPLPPNVQMQIYRIVQEAVNNIWRHAGATFVKMAVYVSPKREFILQLEDNGRAFDPRGQTNSAGRGLANMRARASLIDADLAWAKLETGGTSFVLKLKPATW